MISIENITAGYGKNIVLKNVSANVRQGEFIGLIGPNGSGKTTLLRVLSGVLIPTDGKIMFAGKNLRKISRRTLARSMACLSQDICLDLSFTVRQIALMGRYAHIPATASQTAADLQIADEAMQRADVAHLSERLITEISGGERQRALIAMCLAQQPQVLLLDEPTNHLDVGHQLSVLDLIKKLNHQTNMTVVAVFHDLNLASEYCDKLIVLDNGQIEAAGSPQDVLTSDMIAKVYRTKIFTEKNPVSQKPHIILAAGMNNPINAKKPSSEKDGF